MPVREGQGALKTTHRTCFSLDHKQKATRSSQKPPRWFWGGGGPALLLEQPLGSPGCSASTPAAFPSQNEREEPRKAEKVPKLSLEASSDQTNLQAAPDSTAGTGCSPEH